MGVRLTTIKNKLDVEMELRVFATPARPDRFRQIIRIKPGEKANVLVKTIREQVRSSGRLLIIMVFVDGVYSGITLLPTYLACYSEVICDRGKDGLLNLRGIKATMFNTFKLMLVNHLFLGMNCFGGPPKEIT